MMPRHMTENANQILQLAYLESQRLNHASINAEHVLLALVKWNQGVGINALRNLEVDTSEIRQRVERVLPYGLAASKGPLRASPRAKTIVEYAHEEAGNLKHDHTGTEHLLLALFREEESVAAQVLMDQGVTLETVRDEIGSVLKREKSSENEA